MSSVHTPRLGQLLVQDTRLMRVRADRTLRVYRVCKRAMQCTAESALLCAAVHCPLARTL